jgi:hypothetical protein
MAYNPGVQRLSPLDVAEFREKQYQFDEELPMRQLQGQSYAKQVGLQEKEQEQKRKETLRLLKEENDRQQQLAVAYGMPKEVAQSLSVGELRGFTEKAALDHAEKAKQFRDEDQKLRDREQAAADKARREGLEKVGTVTEANGVKVLRTGPETVQVVQPPRTSRTLDNAPSAQLLSLRNGATKNAMGMMMSYDELSEEQKALVDNIDAILADRGETVRVQPDAAGAGAVAGKAAGAAATPNQGAATVKPKVTGLERWKVSK